MTPSHNKRRLKRRGVARYGARKCAELEGRQTPRNFIARTAATNLARSSLMLRLLRRPWPLACPQARQSRPWCAVRCASAPREVRQVREAGALRAPRPSPLAAFNAPPPAPSPRMPARRVAGLLQGERPKLGRGISDLFARGCLLISRLGESSRLAYTALQTAGGGHCFLPRARARGILFAGDGSQAPRQQEEGGCGGRG